MVFRSEKVNGGKQECRRKKREGGDKEVHGNISNSDTTGLSSAVKMCCGPDGSVNCSL